MLWTVDLDDTLRESEEPEYDAIRFAAAHWYADNADELDAFIDAQAEQSSALYSAWAEGDEKPPTHWTRFPQATANAYTDLVEEPDNLEQGLAYGIGFGAFGTMEYLETHGWIDGTREILQQLSDAGDDIVIITTGDEWIQSRKLVAMNMHELVRDGVIGDIYVVEDKAWAIREAMESFDAAPEETYHVGNSPRSDGAAAEKSGVDWVHVTGPTWEQDEVDDEVDATYRIPSVTALPNIRARV